MRRDGRTREDIVLATKCFGRSGPHRWDQGTNRKNIMRAIDASLRRLETDYVDLYQIHFYDRETPIDETLQAMDDLVTSGKVRYIGCSNTLAYQLARSIGRSELLGISRFESVQPRYNLLFRENERELFPLCAEEHIAVIPYNPLAGGLLTGKHRAGRTDGGHPVHARTIAGDVPPALLAGRDVRHGRRDPRRRRGGGSSAHHARPAVGAREPGDHRADRRRQSSRPARGVGRRRRVAARRPT